MPTKTPSSEPCSRWRVPPSPWSASSQSSRSSRCCGSIAALSAAERPKATLSNSSMPCTKPPYCKQRICTSLSSAMSMASARTQRTAGTLPTASPQATASSLNDGAVATAPGQRPATWPSATGPCESPVRGVGAAAAPTSSPHNVCTRYVPMARAVGCSKTNVGGSTRPVSVRSRLTSSVAASESTPASINGVSASTSVAPVSSWSALSTSCVTCACRWLGVMVRSESLNALPAPAGASRAAPAGPGSAAARRERRQVLQSNDEKLNRQMQVGCFEGARSYNDFFVRTEAKCAKVKGRL
eukprot:6208496-Pleurochrysis_carterae.AAC.1